MLIQTIILKYNIFFNINFLIDLRQTTTCAISIITKQTNQEVFNRLQTSNQMYVVTEGESHSYLSVSISLPNLN